MSVQTIIDSLAVSDQEATEVLEEFCQKATQRIQVLKTSNLKDTVLVAGIIRETEVALDEAELILSNRRRGSDGMTHVCKT
ncbi:hypothetical protein GCM10028805_47180 [Spirosoma harenae]